MTEPSRPNGQRRSHAARTRANARWSGACLPYRADTTTAATILHVSNLWDHEVFREYVISHAKRAKVATSQAGLARATGIDESVLSRWFRGVEQPSLTNLRRLAEGVPGTSVKDLAVLAGRASTDELGMESGPVAPVTAHRHAARIDELLADDSPLPADEKQFLDQTLSRLLERYDNIRRIA